MKELLEALESANNVKSIIYDTRFGRWVVTYKNGLPEDVVDSDNLIDFLYNA